MENIILGVKRNKGTVTNEKTGIKTPFDTINIYLGEYREFEAIGFTFNKNSKTNVVKIRTKDFREITGIGPKAFLENFERDYMFHKARVLLEPEDRFGKQNVGSFKVTKQDCYELWQQEQDDLADDAEVDPLDDGSDADTVYGDSDDEFADVDMASLDKATGEVKEAPKPKAKTKAKKEADDIDELDS